MIDNSSLGLNYLNKIPIDSANISKLRNNFIIEENSNDNSLIEQSLVKKILETNIKEETLSDNFVMRLCKHLEATHAFRIEPSSKNKLLSQERLDLGNCGEVFLKNRSLIQSNISQKDQHYSIPTTTKKRVICEFSECNLKFESDIDFGETFLEENQLKKEDVESTLISASEIIKPFWRNVRKWDIIEILLIILGFFVLASLSIFLGIFVTYYLIFATSGFYFIGSIILIMIIKRRSNQELTLAHIALSLFLKSEKSKYFEKGIKIRPGGIAKWIEFIKLSEANQVKESQIKIQINQRM